jgi:hypothetical protein
VVLGGIFRGFALVGGRAVGLWRLTGRRVEIEPWAELAAGDRVALESDADALTAWLGLA